MSLRLFFIFIFYCATVVSQSNEYSINKIPQNPEGYTISKHYLYSSGSENKDVQEIIADNSFLKFTPKTFINTGIFNRYNWIRIDLLNTSNQSEFIFEFNQTYIDSLQFFIVKNNRVIKTFPKKGLHFHKNNNFPFLSNKYAYTYPISILKNDSVNIYINSIVNDGPFRVTNKIWSKKSYKNREKEIKIKTSYLLFFIGFTSLAILLALIMYFLSKRVLYLYYVGFVTVVFLNLLSLRHFISPLFFEKYLFFGNNFSEMFGYLQIILILQYANYFFSLKSNYPKLHLVLNNLALFTLILYIASLFLRKYDWFYSFSYYFTKIEMVLVTLFLYTIAGYLLFKKNIMAYYFIIAYAPLVFFVRHFILTAMKLTTSYNPLQWEFVIFFEIIVLTIAMAHNYYLLIKENIVYQNKVYAQRVKISRDLHDNIGSQLTFIISSIDNLKFSIKSSNKDLISKLSNISVFASDTISQLRDTIWAMNKNEIPYNDFHTRVLALIEKAKIAKNSIQFTIESNVNSNIVFSSVIGITIFRVLQEAINNVIKYAEASKVTIEIVEENQSLEVSIIDNGKGFDINTVEMGNGLENMQRRIDEINGKLTINSVLGKGTSINIEVKINT